MKEKNTYVKYTRSELDTLPDETDWESVDALSDEDIDAAASSDPDAPPTDASFWKDATLVMPDSKSPSKILDNYMEGQVHKFLESNIKEGSLLSIVSAYFTIYAFKKLEGSLSKIGGLRFLLGEPKSIKSIDPENTDEKAYQIVDKGLELNSQLEQKAIAQECAAWIGDDKVEIRSARQSNLLHGKMYHIANNDVAKAMIGSSNFTVRGLGLNTKGSNIELNLEVDDSTERRDLKTWFDRLWNDKAHVEDVKKEVLEELKRLGMNQNPQFIYYKTLFHLFKDFIDDQAQQGLLAEPTQLIDTEIWKKLYEFQKHGVKGAINKILTYNGCIIADSVGLGKTFEALAVIKYFELRNNTVLVLCPKKLRDNWTVYKADNISDRNLFRKDRFTYTVLSHTDLSYDKGKRGDIELADLNWGNYDLVVIDESHNFRNNTPGKRDEDGQLIRMSRYQRLMESIIQSGIKTKVLLLSATPVNNNLKDLRNQIHFLTEGADDAFNESLGIPNISNTLANAQLIFNQWSKQQDSTPNPNTLLNQLSSTFFKLLDAVTIARSRKHIEKYYKDSLHQLGGFPERSKPVSVYPPIIDVNAAAPSEPVMSYDELNDHISKYQLSLFNPSKYILDDYQSLYDVQQVPNFTQTEREHYLIGMMKVNFLKRLESSVSSFAITMERTIQKIQDLEDRIKRFQQFRAEHTDLDMDDLKIEDLDDEDLEAAMQVGEKLVIKMAHLDVKWWLKDLARDRQQLEPLYHFAKGITVARDAKLAKLKEMVAEKVKTPTIDKRGRPNRKVLVFTAFADTAKYLYDALHQWATEELGIHIAMVSGGSSGCETTFGKKEFNDILTNFSPVSKSRSQMQSMPQDEEIDLLIGTDCISEGQNLQDCDYLINYDIHWNPVRIIQRFGRIDRIGSINHKVQLINFFPTKDLDHYLNLKTRVESRMALVDIAATQGDNLLAPEDIQGAIQTDLGYRDKQLLRLREEVLDLEDFNETVALNAFTLDDFRTDLMQYIEGNRKRLENAPLGLYAVVPPPPNDSIIAPGVVFCLKQKEESNENKQINPTHPYFLVYIREDGEVRFTFSQPKQILEMYRRLCAEAENLYDVLCTLFDRLTNNGADMTLHSDLLQKAVASLSHTYDKRVIGNLLSGRGGVLPAQAEHIRQTTDFELITWLVITKPES